MCGAAVQPTPFLWGLLYCRSSKVITALARLPQGEVSAQELDPANWLSVQRTCSCRQTLRVHRTLTATPAACPPLGKSLVLCEAAAQEFISTAPFALCLAREHGGAFRAWEGGRSDEPTGGWLTGAHSCWCVQARQGTVANLGGRQGDRSPVPFSGIPRPVCTVP